MNADIVLQFLPELQTQHGPAVEQVMAAQVPADEIFLRDGTGPAIQLQVGPDIIKAGVRQA